MRVEGVAAGVARDRILLRRHEREGPAGVRTRFRHVPSKRQGRFALVAGSVGQWRSAAARGARRFDRSRRHAQFVALKGEGQGPDLRREPARSSYLLSPIASSYATTMSVVLLFTWV